MNLTLGWLYYDLMNTYGDRGNVLILQKRAAARKINLSVKEISIESDYKTIQSCDLFMMGGAEDRQQKIVSQDLKNDKKKTLNEKIHSGTPGVYVCGAYQFLGQYYETADGVKLDCLKILPFYTKHPGIKHPRLIGDIVVKVTHEALTNFFNEQRPATTHLNPSYLIGFENHGGRTYLANNKDALGTTLLGHGNNDEKALFEGFVYKNTIGTYLHGPMLPRNPQIADFLLAKALEVKYNHSVSCTSGGR